MFPEPRPSRVVFVCLGNICRSPMAEAVFRSLLTEHGLAGEVVVSSAGTGGWHVGEPADPRAADAVARRGHDLTAHRARQFTADGFDDADLVVALDRANERNLRRLARDEGDRAKIRMLVDGADVPDPYYGGDAGFDAALALVERGCRELLERMRPAG